MCFDQGFLLLSLSLLLIDGLGFRSIEYILLNEVHHLCAGKQYMSREKWCLVSAIKFLFGWRFDCWNFTTSFQFCCFGFLSSHSLQWRVWKWKKFRRVNWLSCCRAVGSSFKSPTESQICSAICQEAQEQY